MAPGIVHRRDAVDRRHVGEPHQVDLWRVSSLPASRRDISVVVGEDEDDETLGDRIRTALGAETEVIESVETIGRTPHEELPEAARERLGTRTGQVNLRLRIVLRPVEETLTGAEANALRNEIYRAVHEGPVMELV